MPGAAQRSFFEAFAALAGTRSSPAITIGSTTQGGETICFVRDNGAASSSNTFISVSKAAEDTVNDLKLTIKTSSLNLDGSIIGLFTLNPAEKLYFHIDPSGNTATVTTDPGAGGRIVAAIYLDGGLEAAVGHDAAVRGFDMPAPFASGVAVRVRGVGFRHG